MIRRGREIAYEAAHATTPFPPLAAEASTGKKSMKPRRTLPSSKSSEKHSVLISAYLSNDLICRYGSKRIDDEEEKASSPFLFDVPFYWNQIAKSKTNEIFSDEEPMTTKDSHPLTQPSKFDSCLTSSAEEEIPSKILSKDESDCSSASEQYSFTDLHDDSPDYTRVEPTIPTMQQSLTPICEESTNIIDLSPTIESHQASLIFTVQRQPNHIGHYGFELEETDDHQIRIGSILDRSFCPNLQLHDEILAVNSNSSLKSLDEYDVLFNSLWHRHVEYIHLTVRQSISSRISHSFR